MGFNNTTYKSVISILGRAFSLSKYIKVEGNTGNERYRRIILTGGSTALVKVISVLINLVTVPMTIHYLGAERYGLWMTVTSVLSLMSFADLGLGNGLLNAISRSHDRKDESQVAVASTFFMLIAISLLLGVTFMIFYSYIPWGVVFNVKTELAIEESSTTMVIMVIFFLINMPLGVVQRIQEGYQEGYRYQLWLLVGSLLSFLGLLICIHFKLGLPSLIIAFSGGQLLAIIANAIYLFIKERPYLTPRFQNFDLIVGKRLLSSGVIFFFLGLFTLAANSSDNIIIAHTLSPKSVAAFEVVKKIFLFSMFTQFIIQPLWPAFAEAIQSGDHIWVRKTLRTALWLSISAGAILALPLLLFGKQLIKAWVGAGYEPGWDLLLGFYFFVIFANYGGVMSTFLNGGPFLSKQFIYVGLSSIAAIVLKIFFSQRFGVSGVIWATVVSYAIFYVVPIYFLSSSYIKSTTKKIN